ncbi:MAG: aminotransferase class V-fold PLP-dependent enzyme [Anaerolineae bacterium]|nr:aminotransferase class V-fold PLP-dependent enzyme [Anaerolineae bacterium]
MIDLTPDEFRRLGYLAVDLIAERMAAQPDLPVRQPVPADLRDRLMSPPGATTADPEALIRRVAEEVLPYPMGNGSPRFMAWVNSPPAPLGILGDLLASAVNPSVAGGDHAATYVEHGVLHWIKSIFGYPADAGAILTSGGSVANLIPLAVMRHCKAADDMRKRGFNGEDFPMVIYTSTQGHSCIQKAAELLGFGSAYLRKIPVDSDQRMSLDALRDAVEDDRAAGLRPVCVAASAGTVNTGAVDPLHAIADLCAAYDMWFHVDGAYGGFGILAPSARAHYAGIERADSIAVDPHKWLYVPVECGCALVRDAAAMRETFSLIPPYLRDDRALPWFSEFGIQQTRGFKALKLWLTLQQVGTDGYSRLIENDIALAGLLQDKILASDDLELAAAGPLSVTCFRYRPNSEMEDGEIDALNRALLPRVQESGEAFVTGTELDGRAVIRACIVNFRTQEAHLDRLLAAVRRAGEETLRADGNSRNRL